MTCAPRSAGCAPASPPPAADRRPHRVDDERLGHRRSLRYTSRTRSNYTGPRRSPGQAAERWTDCTPEQDRLREELREYFAGLMTPEVREALGRAGGDFGGGRPTARSSASSAGTAGWRWAGQPEYGGRGGTMLDQLIFTDEAASPACRSVPDHQHGRPDDHAFRHRRAEGRSSSRISGGEPHFSIGYSEPEARHRPGRPADQGGAGRGRGTSSAAARRCGPA